MECAEKTFIITGGNSGLGYQCALDIAKSGKGNHVVIACRNLEKGNKACANLILETDNANISVLPLDLASFESIRNFCETFSNSKYPPLYGLVCNAAANFSDSSKKTKDGIDITFGVNHLGHFLLANLLVSSMIVNGGRIVFVSSDRHNPFKWMIKDFVYTDALHLAYPNKDRNSSWKYSMSKLCNLYCTYEMSNRLKETGYDVTVNAFNPGYMPETGLNGSRHTLLQKISDKITPAFAFLLGTLGSLEKSSRQLAEMITSPDYENVTGKYFDRGKEVRSSEQSYNREKSENLWNKSVELTHLQQSETLVDL